MQCHCGFATAFDERDRREAFDNGFVRRIDGDIGKDEPLGPDDFAELAPHRIDAAVGAAHMDADRTANPRVDLANRIGKAFGSPPLRELAGIGPGLEHQCAGRIEDAGDRDLALGGLDLICSGRHHQLLRSHFSRLTRPAAVCVHTCPAKARCSAATSNFFMAMSALMARSRFALSASVSICGKTCGTTCQETPNLSLSQPHCPSWPPSLSFCQK